MEKLKVTRVIFALDRSGSMRPILKQAIRKMNENIQTIKEEITKSGQDATISLLTFDDVVDVKFVNRSISSMSEIDENSIVAGNMTALFDATGDAINNMLSIPVGSDENVSYLLNVITDGQENKSQRFDQRSLNALMKKVQATDVWTLTFLVPKGDKRALVNNFGIPEGNVLEWDGSTKGVETYATANNAGLRSYFSARAAGQTNVRSFYVDLGSIDASDVKASLDDVSNDVLVLNVDRDDNIKDFIERKGQTFVKGAAFYELIPGKKTADKIQGYKQIFIMENATKKVFGGAGARQMLGLPNHETKIRPEDHGDFTIFIQSTSQNRKLKKGTKVIFTK